MWLSWWVSCLTSVCFVVVGLLDCVIVLFLCVFVWFVVLGGGFTCCLVVMWLIAVSFAVD